MAPIRMTLSDIQGHFCCLKPFWLLYLGKLTMICLHVNWKSHVACNFNCLVETERVLMVTGNYVHGKMW